MQQTLVLRLQLGDDPHQIVGAKQLPAPSHFCWMSLYMDSFPGIVPQYEPESYVHEVVLFAGLQVPLHVALLPVQSERAGIAARWGTPETPVHVPTEPLTSQAWHWPVQVELQQTPSVQKKPL